MDLLEAIRACEYEAVWLGEAHFRAGLQGVDDVVAAIKKIQNNADELREAEDKLRKYYGR